MEKTTPRNQCENYILERKGQAVFLTKEEFDGYVRKKDFSEGPYRDSSGDGYGEPYNPRRQAFGTLNDGRIVFTELN